MQPISLSGVLLIAVLAPAVAPAAALAQVYVVAGTVVDASDGRPIEGASVAIAGRSSPTNDQGRFIVDGVTPGRYTLAVVMLGYERTTVDLDLRADTILSIEMASAPIELDPINVRGVTIRGTLRDATSGLIIRGGEVSLYPESRTVSAMNGSFTMDEVPPGTVEVVVRAREYLPTSIVFDATKDTTFVFEMEVDSVGIKLIRRQVDRLDQRVRRLPRTVRALNRDDVARTAAPSVGDLLQRELPVGMLARHPAGGIQSRPSSQGTMRSRTGVAVRRGISCIMYDGSQLESSQVLFAMPLIDIERIEIIGSRRDMMIRIYSKRYVASLMRRRTLPGITYINTGLNVVCT